MSQQHLATYPLFLDLLKYAFTLYTTEIILSNGTQRSEFAWAKINGIFHSTCFSNPPVPIS
jgi:hypothetical protein